MTELYWDLSSGAAGDMLLASLIAAGADAKRIQEDLLRLGVPDWHMDILSTERAGIAATQVIVVDHTLESDDHTHEHLHATKTPHSHDVHGVAYQSGGKPKRAHPHRHLADLLAITSCAPLPEWPCQWAALVFRLLAEAEGKVHGLPPEEVHFHELSGIDTIIDVFGVCLALEQLEVSRVCASLATTGCGQIQCEHGLMPVPAPATLEILQRCKIPFVQGEIPHELLTPTGAALLGTLCDGFGPCPPGRIVASGYGAGGRDLPGKANVVRAVLLDTSKVVPGQKSALPDSTPTVPAATAVTAATAAHPESVMRAATPAPAAAPATPAAPEPAPAPAKTEPQATPAAHTHEGEESYLRDEVIEFRMALDDCSGEEAGRLLELCYAAGAYEAYLLPTVMKKSRPGHEMVVLCPLEKEQSVATAVFRSGLTLGMRRSRMERLILPRSETTVQVAGGAVRIKTGQFEGKTVFLKPEYDDCARLAHQTGLPLAEIRYRARLEFSSGDILPDQPKS